MAEPRTRNTTRHREAAAASRAETRRRLLRAAGEEFRERGYHAATVSRIAARAGVTVQTLYLAWGSKRELLRACLDVALSGDPRRPYADALPQIIDGAIADAGDDAHQLMARAAHLYRTLAERAALGWRLYRDAAASDPEVAADWRALQLLRRETFGVIVRRVPAGALRPGLSYESAADTAWAIASPETHELLVETLGYTLDRYESWVAATLTDALLG